jgi:hypothetical protein
MKQSLKEAWDGMVKEGLLDSLTKPPIPNSQQQQDQTQSADPATQQKIQNLKKMILDIEKKIAPLADKKRKLEEEIYKLSEKK